jgi:hypothetical protein
MTSTARPTIAGLYGKQRSAGAIVGLNIVTLGLYSIYWWYTINRELRDLGRGRGALGLGETPALSTLAYISGPCLLLPYIWTAVTTSKRVHRAQELIGTKPIQLSLPIGLFAIGLLACLALGTVSGGALLAVLAFSFAAGVAAMAYLQSALNKVWDAAGVLPEPPSHPDVAPSTA